MSALDDAYRAAYWATQPDPDNDPAVVEAHIRRAIPAFLAHLADNPPEEMMDAAERIIAVSPRKAIYEAAYDLSRVAVPAALRSLTTERAST